MIDCPKCGTRNRDGSSFCSRCGEELGAQTHIACPECGTLNPIQNASCSECGEPLQSLPTLTPGAETAATEDGVLPPTLGATNDQDADEVPVPSPEAEEEVPAWLRELETTLRSKSQSDESEAWDGDSDIPDWLRDLRASLPAEPEADQERAEESAPDWLAAYPSPTQVEESLLADEAETAMPDWLAELRSYTDREAEVPQEGGEELTPNWLAGSRQAEEEEPRPGFEAEDEELPDWLAELRSSVTVGEMEPASELEEESLPDWLAELEPAAQAPGEPTVGEQEEEKPDSLAELRPAFSEGEAEADAEGEGGPEDEELAGFEATVVAAEAEPAPSAEEPRLGEVPAWLAAFQAAALEEDQPPGEEVPVGVEGPDWLVPVSAEEKEEPLARAEIPAWLLALKPAELREEEEAPALSPQEPVDATGILAGLQGTLPVEMIIAQPRAVTLETALESPPSDTPQAHLFAEIVGRPPAAAPRELVHAPSRALELLPRWFIYLALIAVVTLPLLLGEAVLLQAPTPIPATEDLHNAVEALGSEAPVMVAFDYDPTTSGEMDLLAQALVGHLMDRGARVVAVSLLPAGPATAQTILEQLAAEQPGYADSYGQRYVNLGYLPGQATAVRLLGLSLPAAIPRDFNGTPLGELAVMEGLSTTQSFDLIVELAATQGTLRTWIEQASAPYALQLGAGVSASVEPLARPYYETEPRQLVGLVSGVPGAAAYQALVGDQGTVADSAPARLDSQLLGHLVLILILLIGNVGYLARHRGRREL